MNELRQEDVKKVIQPRPEESYKGTFGRVVIIGGNHQYGGAVIMSTEAAVRSGAGLVTVITNKKNHTPIHTRLPEAMVWNWENQQGISNITRTADVILIGPGLGLKKHAQVLLKKIIEEQTKNQWLVIDGSAIRLYASMTLDFNYPHQVVFTPHQMEWQHLTGLTLEQQTYGNNQMAQRKLDTTVVLKSHRTQIYSLQSTYKNPIGTPAMATGGMGDTLAGMIAGFLAQFPNKLAAINAAVYLHSWIGEQLSKEHYVVLPTTISQHIPYYMKKME